MKINDILNENQQTDTITLYHGGRGLEFGGHREIVPNSKGKWEYGPGLYLTTSYMRAKDYAKGGRKVYKVEIRRGRNLSDSFIPFQAVQNFTNQYIPSNKRRNFIDYINEIMERQGLTDKVPATSFINLIINDNLIQSSKTPALNRFLVDNGIDYDIVKNYGGSGETVVVIFNRDVIEKVTLMGKEKVTDFDVDFPWGK